MKLLTRQGDFPGIVDGLNQGKASFERGLLAASEGALGGDHYAEGVNNRLALRSELAR